MPITLPVSYCVVGDLTMTVPAIGSVSTITSATLAFFIQGAQALIDSKLAKLYQVPFSDAPPVVQTLAIDISLYEILTKRIFTQEKINDSVWPDRFKSAIDLLNEIASGKVALVDSSGQIVQGRSDVADVWSDKQDRYPTMHDGAWEDMIQDPSMLDDIDATRS